MIDPGYPAIAAAALAAGAIITLGAVRLQRRRQELVLPPPPLEPARAVIPAFPAPPLPVPVGHMCTVFRGWLADNPDLAQLWISFDQLVREALTEDLGATRVRCFHVRQGSETLQTISQARKGPTQPGPSQREGVLGHAATTGREYVASDPAKGPLLERLAASSDDDWTWVWPIRDSSGTIGIVAVGKLRQPELLTPEARQTIGPLLSLMWQHVACVERLQTIRRTDHASGVLTRGDFFAMAALALSDSYANNEPVVLATLDVEGLRRLDDQGCWRQRDTLIESLGQLILQRIRSDDLVGRFADNRFVALLRRLDSGLGRLIAEKLLAGSQECLDAAGSLSDRVKLRVGLSGSGLARPSLEKLLTASFDAIDRGRRRGVPIESDLDAPPSASGSDAAPSRGDKK